MRWKERHVLVRASLHEGNLCECVEKTCEMLGLVQEKQRKSWKGPESEFLKQSEHREWSSLQGCLVRLERSGGQGVCAQDAHRALTAQ